MPRKGAGTMPSASSSESAVVIWKPCPTAPSAVPSKYKWRCAWCAKGHTTRPDALKDGATRLAVDAVEVSRLSKCIVTSEASNARVAHNFCDSSCAAQAHFVTTADVMRVVCCRVLFCHHCGYIEVSPLSDPNSAVPVSKRTCERRAIHCSAMLWGYEPSVARPIVGFLGVDLSVPVFNAVSINCSSGDKFVAINSWKTNKP